jgi:hypothetical protein
MCDLLLKQHDASQVCGWYCHTHVLVGADWCSDVQVRRFVKFNLGEGLEKKSNDFAAEVAQQTQKKEAAPAAAKPAAKEQPKQQVSTSDAAVGHEITL